MNKLTGLADSAGVLASALCLIHCLATPLLLAALPSLAGDDGLHETMVGVALLAALAALLPGYAAHRRMLVPLLGVAGLGCLACAVFVAGPRHGEAAETWLSVAGAVLLCTAHVRNRMCCGARTGAATRPGGET